MEKIRAPICAVVGHVDHGKSSLLDYIRCTNIVMNEPGAITQAIGASLVPLETIKKICGPLLDSVKISFKIPGLLFIDTPGHAAFTNLRKRGGSLADIAILVVDINEGFKPQTYEALAILKQEKTPFVVAATKVDLISGWVAGNGKPIIETLNKQSSDTLRKFETKLYELVGVLYENGLQSERFDRMSDYTKQVAIIPVSSKTGDGIPELLMVITGLTQKYLETCLSCNVEGPAKGTILEVKNELGLGIALDVIIYDGTLRKDDIIVIGGFEKPIVSKVKCIFKPLPLYEMRDKKAKFIQVNEVSAAAAVRISAPNCDEVIAGMPIMSTSGNNLDKTKNEVQKLVAEFMLNIDPEGIIVKADSLGSLEALVNIFHEHNIKIRSASVGNISKKDIIDAETNYELNPLYAAIVGFNVGVNKDAQSNKVKVFLGNIIYKLVEDYEQWASGEIKRRELKALNQLVRPCKIKVLPGYVFRQSNPAIVGVEVLDGILKTGISLMKDGKPLGIVREIQADKKNIYEAKKGQQVAIAIEKVTIGRQVKEGDVLYSYIPEDNFRKLRALKQHLTESEIVLLQEIADIMRNENALWGI